MPKDEDIGTIEIDYDQYTGDERILRAQIIEFKGRTGLDIRIHTIRRGEDPYPTIRGVRIPLDKVEEFMTLLLNAHVAVQRRLDKHDRPVVLP